MFALVFLAEKVRFDESKSRIAKSIFVLEGTEQRPEGGLGVKTTTASAGYLRRYSKTCELPGRAFLFPE